MEILIQVLMVFILIGTIIKQSLDRPLQNIVFGVVCGLFVWLSYPYAIEQTKVGIAAYIGNRELRESMAIVLSFEAILFSLYVFAPEKRSGKGIWASVTNFFGRILPMVYPGLLILPVLFYLQTMLIFALPGLNFDLLSMALALGVAVMIPLLASLVRSALPEHDFRLEVLFLSSLFIFILGTLTTVDDTTLYAPTSAPLEWRQIGVAFAVVLGLFLLGRYSYLFKRRAGRH